MKIVQNEIKIGDTTVVLNIPDMCLIDTTARNTMNDWVNYINYHQNKKREKRLDTINNLLKKN